LPMAYNRDLQDDKRAMFDAYDTVVACLEVAPQVIAGAELRREVIASRIDDGFLDATALMEYLIRRGVPMRTGHEVVGKLVAECEGRKCRLGDLSLDEIRKLVPAAAAALIDESVSKVLGSAHAAAALVSYGSGSKVRVAEQLAEWKKRLA